MAQVCTIQKWWFFWDDIQENNTHQTTNGERKRREKRKRLREFCTCVHNTHTNTNMRTYAYTFVCTQRSNISTQKSNQLNVLDYSKTLQIFNPELLHGSSKISLTECFRCLSNRKIPYKPCGLCVFCYFRIVNFFSNHEYMLFWTFK